MHPHALETPAASGEYTPVPSKLNAPRTSFVPSPFTKTCVFSVPLMSPAVDTCKISTRLFIGSGRPLGVPFNTYQAPPVWSSITMSCPSIALAAAKAPTHGWSALSTVLIELSLPSGCDSIPMVTQLSAAKSGKKAKNAGFTPPAVVAPNWLL